MPSLHRTPIPKFRRAFTTNSTAAAWTEPVPTATKPAASSVRSIHDLAGSGQPFCPPTLKGVPFGSNANNETFILMLVGWNYSLDGSLWIPHELAQFTCTLGNVATGTSNEFVADTIAITHGTADQGMRVVSNADDRAAYFLIEVPGVELLEIQVKLGTGDSGNCWFGFTDTQL